jgi:hypothetical protein
MQVNHARGLIEHVTIATCVPKIRGCLAETLIKAMKATEEAVRSMEAEDTYLNGNPMGSFKP